MASTRQQRRQLERRRAREEARRAAERAARRRSILRIAIPVGAAVIIAAGIAFAVLSGDDDEEAVDTTATTGAGEPCVKVADPLPAGAPEVPVKEGPPPAKLVKEDLKIGEGEEVKPGDTVNAHYIGVACSTGKIFDSSWSRGQPSEFELAKVVKGWQEGLPGMKVGGRRLLGIPPDLGYGTTGQGDVIGPNETLWFVVDIVGTKRA